MYSPQAHAWNTLISSKKKFRTPLHTMERKRFVKRPCHQWNTQASNATHANMALEKRTPNTTHPRSSRIAPARKRGQFNQARLDANTPSREIAKKNSPPPVPPKNQKNEHTSLKSSRVHAQLNDGFWQCVALRHLSPKNWTDLGACFDHTHISQTWCIWNDNLHPTSTSRHVDRPWHDQPFWWARTSFSAQKSAENLDAPFL